MLVGVTTNFVKEDDDKDLFPTDGLLVEEVDLELAVEFLVLERDLDRGWTETLAGVISILEWRLRNEMDCENLNNYKKYKVSRENLRNTIKASEKGCKTLRQYAD